MSKSQPVYDFAIAVKALQDYARIATPATRNAITAQLPALIAAGERMKQLELTNSRYLMLSADALHKRAAADTRLRNITTLQMQHIAMLEIRHAQLLEDFHHNEQQHKELLEKFDTLLESKVNEALDFINDLKKQAA